MFPLKERLAARAARAEENRTIPGASRDDLQRAAETAVARADAAAGVASAPLAERAKTAGKKGGKKAPTEPVAPADPFATK